MHPFIALTDQAWFDYLSDQAADGRLDEANFWNPSATRPMKKMDPGTPVFLRLKKPHYAIAGYGFFAHWSLLDLDAAWDFFGWKNGDPDKLRFLRRLSGYRKVDLLAPGAERRPVGCTVLRSLRLWPRERWLPWGDGMSWPRNVVQGRTETDPTRAAVLLSEIATDQHAAPPEFADDFELVEADERSIVATQTAQREGQGTFRSRLLDAYSRRCAITGEHTEPVLDAAHIQPYLGPRSNHLQNGLLLTKEFHVLFDRGLVTVTPDNKVRVSPRIRAEWRNGHRYYPFDGRELEVLPDQARIRPSRRALEWHSDTRFLR